MQFPARATAGLRIVTGIIVVLVLAECGFSASGGSGSISFGPNAGG